MREHEWRKQVAGEMHLRRWPLISLPTLIIQWVRVVDDTEREAESRALDQFAEMDAQSAAITSPRHRMGTLSGGISFAWERHSESSSLTLFIDPGFADPGFIEPGFADPGFIDPGFADPGFIDPGFADPGSEKSGKSGQPGKIGRSGTGKPGPAQLLLHPNSCDALASALKWSEGLPGKIVRAMRILALADEQAIEAILPDCEFSASELVSCHLGGQIRIFSDFRVRDDGYGLMTVAANGATSADFTRYLQRLQELGNYRNKALLGLPVARANWPRLNDAEAALDRLAAMVPDPAVRDDDLMVQLSEVSMELMSIATSSSYRMNATAAYARIVQERLEELDIGAIPGFASLEDFTQRRFFPAIRTCTALTEREHQLSLRAAQFSSLLRTRIETRIENQNASLLRSMERSSTMQLRLQMLVEGLSVVALSYYVLGLIAYVLKGAESIWHGLDPHLITGVIAAPLVFLVWLAVHKAKKRLLGKG